MVTAAAFSIGHCLYTPDWFKQALQLGRGENEWMSTLRNDVVVARNLRLTPPTIFEATVALR